jgi:hypothetical protein
LKVFAQIIQDCRCKEIDAICRPRAFQQKL